MPRPACGKTEFRSRPCASSSAAREIRSTIRFYLRNVRLPDWLEADLRAMVGAVRAGAGRLQEMTETHGIDVVVPTLAEMINYAERRTAAEIRALPDGVYHGEGWIDSDGQGTHNIRIACTVTIDDDTIHIDFTGSDPQAGGHCNATVATMEACGSIPVLTIIDPTIPRNEGCTRRIRVTAPEVQWRTRVGLRARGGAPSTPAIF